MPHRATETQVRTESQASVYTGLKLLGTFYAGQTSPALMLGADELLPAADDIESDDDDELVRAERRRSRCSDIFDSDDEHSEGSYMEDYDEEEAGNAGGGSLIGSLFGW